MKKGHRRTQSSFVSRSDMNLTDEVPREQKSAHNDIVDLLKLSQNKVQKKIITYEKLQLNSGPFCFGDNTIQQLNSKFNAKTIHNEFPFRQSNLESIEEKSSQMSSQKMSQQHLDILFHDKYTNQNNKTSQYLFKHKRIIPTLQHKKSKSFKIK